MSDQAQAPVVSTPTTPAAPVVASDAKPAAAPVAPAVPLDAGEKPTIEVDQGVSKHFAEIERRKAAVRAEEKRIAEARKAEEPERAEFEAFRKAKADAKKKPFEALVALGLTNEDIAQALMDAPSAPTPVDKVTERLASVEKALEEERAARAKERADSEAATKRETDAKNVANVRTNITKTLEAPEFVFTKRLGADGVELVFDTMTVHWERTIDPTTKRGKILPYPEACAQVEKYFAKLAAGDAAADQSKAQTDAAATPAPGSKAQTAKAITATEKPVLITNKTNADTPPSAQPTDAAANKARAIRVLNERMAAKRAALAKKGP